MPKPRSSRSSNPGAKRPSKPTGRSKAAGFSRGASSAGSGRFSKLGKPMGPTSSGSISPKAPKPPSAAAKARSPKAFKGAATLKPAKKHKPVKSAGSALSAKPAKAVKPAAPIPKNPPKRVYKPARKPKKPAAPSTTAKPQAESLADSPLLRTRAEVDAASIASPDEQMSGLDVDDASDDASLASEAPAAAPGSLTNTRPSSSASAPQLTRARQFAIESARLLDDNGCENIVLLEVKGLSPMCDYIVVGSGSSDRQMRSTADDVIDLAQQSGHTTFRRNVDEKTTWYVVDFVDVVVHLFEPNTRAHYDIEMMWGDAPRLDWARPPGEVPPARTRNRSAIKALPDGEEEGV